LGEKNPKKSEEKVNEDTRFLVFAFLPSTESKESGRNEKMQKSLKTPWIDPSLAPYVLKSRLTRDFLFS
jgi:hypothetical protein